MRQTDLFIACKFRLNLFQGLLKKTITLQKSVGHFQPNWLERMPRPHIVFEKLLREEEARRFHNGILFLYTAPKPYCLCILPDFACKEVPILLAMCVSAGESLGEQR